MPTGKRGHSKTRENKGTMSTNVTVTAADNYQVCLKTCKLNPGFKRGCWSCGDLIMECEKHFQVEESDETSMWFCSNQCHTSFRVMMWADAIMCGDSTFEELAESLPSQTKDQLEQYLVDMSAPDL